MASMDGHDVVPEEVGLLERLNTRLCPTFWRCFEELQSNAVRPLGKDQPTKNFNYRFMETIIYVRLFKDV